jgi:hypothetical protein
MVLTLLDWVAFGLQVPAVVSLTATCQEGTLRSSLPDRRVGFGPRRNGTWPEWVGRRHPVAFSNQQRIVEWRLVQDRHLFGSVESPTLAAFHPLKTPRELLVDVPGRREQRRSSWIIPPVPGSGRASPAWVCFCLLPAVAPRTSPRNRPRRPILLSRRSLHRSLRPIHQPPLRAKPRPGNFRAVCSWGDPLRNPAL